MNYFIVIVEKDIVCNKYVEIKLCNIYIWYLVLDLIFCYYWCCEVYVCLYCLD